MEGRFPKQTPGMSTPSISAAAWNKLMDMLEWYDREVVHAQKAIRLPKEFHRRNGVLIKNATEQSLNRGNVVAINGSVYDPTKTQQLDFFQDEPIFIGTLPEFPSDIGNFAILQEPIGIDGIGWASTNGVVSCTIDMQYQAHKYADIYDGSAGKLKSAEYGGAEILYVQDMNAVSWSSGEKKALVKLGCFHSPLLCVVWEGALAAASSITAYVYDNTGPGASPSTDPDARQITLYGSQNQYGDSQTLIHPEFAWAKLHRPTGQIELISSSKQYPLPPP